MKEHPQFDIGRPTVNENKLWNAMSLAGIPSDMLIRENNAVKLKQLDEAQSSVTYVGSKGNTVSSSIPIDY
ncbi:hypothetical protein SFC55_19300 [Niallia taxi]|uniref:hypothetical protein n=1 Tax=Niallia taxi TaxID=2499688 RepID=UPI00398206F9